MSAGPQAEFEQPLHVLTLTPFYPVAGDDARGCFVAEPLPWLARAGVANSVLAVQPFYRGRARISDSAPPARAAQYLALPGGFGLSSSGAFLYARILPQIRRTHRSHAVDLIHAHAPLPCGHAAMLLSRELGIPYVVTVHGLDAFSTNQVKGRAGEWCRRVCRMAYGSASQVICISERVRGEVIGGSGTPIRTTVVYNGVDAEAFSPCEDTTQPLILSVGNLISIKGHDLLLRAVAAVKHQYPDVACEIIGDGPERSRLNQLVAQLQIADKVRFLGRQSRGQVADAMRRCTLFALPSQYEGLGCVYLEAMSAEKAVIACRGQGIEEIVQHGINGWLVDPKDLQGLTDALSLLLQNEQLRRKMGETARRTILQGLTLAHQAGRLARVYRECLA